MDKQVIARILAAYGIENANIGEPQKGYRNASHLVTTPSGDCLNLILYKIEPGIVTRIKNANAVGNYLTPRGVPARRTYDDRVIRLVTPNGVQKFGGLYYYLPGKTIPWEAYTMAHIKALGKTMSDMHALLKSYNVAKLPEVAQENLQLNRRMLRYFADPNAATALQNKLGLRVVQADYTKLLTATKMLPGQALHMDFVRGNILFEGTKISGILDFEKTAKGHILYDIARTLAFLLVDCKYKPEHKVRKYFLQSGYIKRGANAVQDVKIGSISLLEELINFFLLHDFYKFLRHNPYESLPQNEHFMRTRAMLLKRRLIAKV